MTALVLAVDHRSRPLGLMATRAVVSWVATDLAAGRATVEIPLADESRRWRSLLGAPSRARAAQGAQDVGGESRRRLPDDRQRPRRRGGRCDVSWFGVRRHSGPAPFSTEGRLPGFDGATGWLNSEPLTADDVRGKVVLVDFWTYTCINWLRTLAYIRAWAETYEDRGLVVVGVHTPEFPFERDVDNVRRAVEAMNIRYPVALDSDYGVWRAFANRYWPAVYIADAEGRIRHHQFGEGGYDECEMIVQQLLREAGREGVGDDMAPVVPTGIEAQADWSSLESPETYLGYEQGRSFASPGGAALDEPRLYDAPESLRLNQWSLSGEWAIERGASVLHQAGGRIAFRFHARDVHLVMGPRERGASVPFRVLVDGAPPGDAHGLDVDEQGNGTLAEQRLHQLVRQRGSIADRTFEISFLAAGAEAYVFTFG